MTLNKNNKSLENFKLEKFKKSRCFSGWDVDARAATSVEPQKSGSPGGLRGVPVLAETPAARSAAVSVIVVLEAAKTPKRGSPDGERTEGRTPF